MSRLIARTVMPPAVAAIAVALLLTGCAGDGAPSTPVPSSSTPPTTSPSPTSTASADPNAPAEQCADDALKVEVTYVDAGAGSTDYSIVFTNTGSGSCELRGAPGVSVVNASGVQIGEAAARQGDEDPPTLTLQPGTSVSAPLQAVNIAPDGGPLDDCPVMEGAAFFVYPPHSFTGFTAATGDPVPACESTTSFLTVGPVQAN